MTDCIFCKIANHEIPAEIIAENDDLIVFKDIHPDAPIHYLIVPKKHIESLTDVPNEILIKIKEIMIELANKENLKGFRTVMNWGEYQAVKHLHFHFTSGFIKTNY